MVCCFGLLEDLASLGLRIDAGSHRLELSFRGEMARERTGNGMGVHFVPSRGLLEDASSPFHDRSRVRLRSDNDAHDAMTPSSSHIICMYARAHI
jgi:hypothetical protein